MMTITGSVFSIFVKFYPYVSPCISAATISYLTELIAAHHELFKECYHTVCITPKLHYMIHIPEHIKRLST